jgi:DNA (cytosine-5)-methyltransferase 1
VSHARPTVLSLYSGAGGLDLGFKQSGFNLVSANERDEHACETYRQNIGSHIVEGDVLSTPLPDIDVDVVVGGPPCQGWSRIGKMDPDDSRSQHVHRFLDVVERVGPRALVMENVAHLAESRRWRHVREQLLGRARDLGYQAELFVVDASHFGVPQARRRMFLVGLRDRTPIAPLPWTSRTPRTVRRTLHALPPYGQRGNEAGCRARVVPAKDPVIRPSAFQGALLFNGSGRPLALDLPARTLPASMGGNATPIIDQIELAHGQSPWVATYRDRLATGEPPLSQAPERMRRITVREAAALQSFPAWFDFAGPVGAQYRQIGNAVPPALARAVARALLSAMTAPQRDSRERAA